MIEHIVRMFSLSVCTCERQAALYVVLKESFKLYKALSEGLINLADCFFEMDHAAGRQGPGRVPRSHRRQQPPTGTPRLSLCWMPSFILLCACFVTATCWSPAWCVPASTMAFLTGHTAV